MKRWIFHDFPPFFPVIIPFAHGNHGKKNGNCPASPGWCCPWSAAESRWHLALLAPANNVRRCHWTIESLASIVVKHVVKHVVKPQSKPIPTGHYYLTWGKSLGVPWCTQCSHLISSCWPHLGQFPPSFHQGRPSLDTSPRNGGSWRSCPSSIAFRKRPMMADACPTLGTLGMLFLPWFLPFWDSFLDCTVMETQDPRVLRLIPRIPCTYWSPSTVFSLAWLTGPACTWTPP